MYLNDVKLEFDCPIKLLCIHINLKLFTEITHIQKLKSVHAARKQI